MEAIIIGSRSIRCSGYETQPSKCMQPDPERKFDGSHHLIEVYSMQWLKSTNLRGHAVRSCKAPALLEHCAVRTVVLSFDQFMVVWTRVLERFHSGSVATLSRMNTVRTKEDRESSPDCVEEIKYWIKQMLVINENNI